MNTSSFSQSLSSPKIVIDTNGVEMLAFTTTQLDIIKNKLVLAGLNKRRVKILDKKINLLNSKIITQSYLIDSLDQQYQTCIQISINKDGQIEVKEKQIEELEYAISDYDDVVEAGDNISKEKDYIIEALKSKINEKNLIITGLIIIDILIILILI